MRWLAVGPVFVSWDLLEGIMFLLCLGAAMLASPIQPLLDSDSFTDDHNHKSFHLAGVPDFDQNREAATVKVAGKDHSLKGLPNHGGEYCVPTSAIDWMAFLAARGIPGLKPKATDLDASYTSGIKGYNTYEAVTAAIDHMGNLMG